MAAVLTKPVQQDLLFETLACAGRDASAPTCVASPHAVGCRALDFDRCCGAIGSLRIIANNGREALTALDWTVYALVLMNIPIPEMDRCERQ